MTGEAGLAFDCIVAALHLRYDGIQQRPHHLLARLGERVPLLVVEEPLRATLDASDIEAIGAVTRLRPKRHDPLAAPIDARTIADVRAWVGGRRPLVWMYQPLMLALADAFPEADIVYDCMDDLASFELASPRLPQLEADLQARAALVFTGGRSLFERRRSLGPKVRLYPSGVDVEHFARALALARPQMLASLARPVCTYVGAIDERVDFAPIRALAERGASVVLVGPVVKIDPATLPRHPNVHFAGPVSYADLPPLLAGTDVGLMPFALNEATRSISPTKTPEYLSAGLPIVSTEIADVRADYGDVVRFASDPEAFADACFAAYAAGAEEADARMQAVARNGTWDDIVTRMWRDLESEPRLRR